MFFKKSARPNAAVSSAAAKLRPKFPAFPSLGNGFVSSSAHVLLRQAIELLRNLRHALKPKTVFLLTIALFVVIVFGRNIKDILLVGVLAFVASYSTIYKRTIHVPSAVEMVTFGTVITGAAYGPLAGVLFGVFTTIASEIISSGVDVNTLFYAISRGIAGGLAQMMIVGFGWGVVMAGMAALVIFHVVSDFIYVISGGIEAVPKIIYFIIVNTLFNLLVFSFFGNLLLGFAML
ncbi:hypothetical protein HYV83_02605 [Candidatus Woesearchaeota archaeon]|nr:hypothetical protein [Candidatus Woesearchaeota archaeon]